jgi:imidazole glycerol-phosphate synthase subunit HisH
VPLIDDELSKYDLRRAADMNKVAVVDSGSANLNSIYKALIKVSVDAFVTDSPAALAGADGVVFPGVGAFEPAMALLRGKGLAPALLDCIAAGKPFLGICLGLQLLFSASEERADPRGPLPAGLNAIPGLVRRFRGDLPVPHVGWNQAAPAAGQPHPLFDDLTENDYFYFTHSYYVEPAEPANVIALTEYGAPFASAAARGNLMGVQFHPEKSGPAGLRLLSNFGKIIADPTGLQ